MHQSLIGCSGKGILDALLVALCSGHPAIVVRIRMLRATVADFIAQGFLMKLPAVLPRVHRRRRASR